MQLFVIPVFNLCRIGRIEGQTLRYPAGRPIHGLFVIVFPHGVIPGGVSSLLEGGVAYRIPVQVFLQQRPQAIVMFRRGLRAGRFVLEKNRGVVIRR